MQMQVTRYPLGFSKGAPTSNDLCPPAFSVKKVKKVYSANLPNNSTAAAGPLFLLVLNLTWIRRKQRRNKFMGHDLNKDDHIDIM